MYIYSGWISQKINYILIKLFKKQTNSRKHLPNRFMSPALHWYENQTKILQEKYVGWSGLMSTIYFEMHQNQVKLVNWYRDE